MTFGGIMLSTKPNISGEGDNAIFDRYDPSRDFEKCPQLKIGKI